MPFDFEALFHYLPSISPLSLCFFSFLPRFSTAVFSTATALTLSDGTMELSNSMPCPVVVVIGAPEIIPSLAANSAYRSFCCEYLSVTNIRVCGMYVARLWNHFYAHRHTHGSTHITMPWIKLWLHGLLLFSHCNYFLELNCRLVIKRAVIQVPSRSCSYN